MKKIFVTGVSGTGKTTLANALNARGIHAISIDETPDLCCWKNKITGERAEHEHELNQAFIDAHHWVCDKKFLQKLLDASKEDVVVLGIASNQKEFMPLFDRVLLLQCRPETFVERIVRREDNDFGKDKDTRASILRWYEKFERETLQKGAISINAEEPIEKVVEHVVREIKAISPASHSPFHP
jgi:dephospho-CoA kinase